MNFGLTIIFECSVCGRGMIQRGISPVPFYFNPVSLKEYCLEHKPVPSLINPDHVSRVLQDIKKYFGENNHPNGGQTN